MERWEKALKDVGTWLVKYHTHLGLSALLRSRLGEWEACQQRQPMLNQDRAISELQATQDEIGCDAMMLGHISIHWREIQVQYY
jgi:hypothetical protein